MKFWSGIEVWGYKNGKLTTQQRTTCNNIVGKIYKNTQLTEKECIKGEKILEVARDNNLNLEEIKKISPLKTEKSQDIDVVNVYNRLKKISRDDWNRIIGILEQTQKREDKLISITRAISKKALNGENISDRMLFHMPKVFDIAKKFGINV